MYQESWFKIFKHDHATDSFVLFAAICLLLLVGCMQKQIIDVIVGFISIDSDLKNDSALKCMATTWPKHTNNTQNTHNTHSTNLRRYKIIINADVVHNFFLLDLYSCLPFPTWIQSANGKSIVLPFEHQQRCYVLLLFALYLEQQRQAPAAAHTFSHHWIDDFPFFHLVYLFNFIVFCFVVCKMRHWCNCWTLHVQNVVQFVHLAAQNEHRKKWRKKRELLFYSLEIATVCAFVASFYAM